MRFRAPLSSLFFLSLLAACDSGDSTRADESAATSGDPTGPTTDSPDETAPEPDAPTPPSSPDDDDDPTPPEGEAGGPGSVTTPEPSPVGPPGGMGGEPNNVAPNVEPPVSGPTAGSGGTPDPGPSGDAGSATAGSGANGGSSGMSGGGGAPVLQTGTPIVVVGGFDYSGGSYPLRVYNVDKETGALEQRGGDVDVGPNPSYLTLAPGGGFLYVANETDDDNGGLSAVALAGDGALSLVNHQTGMDGGFTFVAVDPSGRYAFGASYNGGSVSVFPIEDDGSLGPELDNRDFGDGAQSHCIGFDPSGQFAFVPNKGNNEVAQLVLENDGMLADNSPAVVAAEPGAGPRHFALHPSGDFAFVINELGSSMTPYQLGSDGTLTPGTTVSTLPSDFNGQNSGAHVEVSPDGRFVYGSNRGDDSIAVFAVDASSGELTLVEHESTGGQTPRDFEMDPQGDVLIVANQDSDTLTVFAIGEDGGLTPLGDPVPGPPSPAAVQMIYLAE